jgi:hypothetical protein
MLLKKLEERIEDYEKEGPLLRLSLPFRLIFDIALFCEP